MRFVVPWIYARDTAIMIAYEEYEQWMADQHGW